MWHFCLGALCFGIECKIFWGKLTKIFLVSSVCLLQLHTSRGMFLSSDSLWENWIEFLMCAPSGSRKVNSRFSYSLLTVLTKSTDQLIQHSHYYGCWYSGSLRRQDISTHGIAYVEWVSSCFILGQISATCVMSVWRNSINCKYILMLRMKNLACKRLN